MNNDSFALQGPPQLRANLNSEIGSAFPGHIIEDIVEHLETAALVTADPDPRAGRALDYYPRLCTGMSTKP